MNNEEMANGVRPKALMTAPEVARLLGVDLKTIHNWTKQGEFKHFRTPGRHLRFRRQDIEYFMAKHGFGGDQ
jgi:excisionase family DNA binding protein